MNLKSTMSTTSRGIEQGKTPLLKLNERVHLLKILFPSIAGQVTINIKRTEKFVEKFTH